MQSVVILGGTGFVGRALCRLLISIGGWRITVPTRHPERAKVPSVLSQVDLGRADVHDEAQLRRVIAGQDSVVNLIAILHGSAADFDRVHVELPEKLARACKAAGVQRLVHVSALGVQSATPSLYLKSKAKGERLLREAQLALTVLRPSVIFGAEDRFLNTFERLQRMAPFVPLACSEARFQPVWVDDVAQAVAMCLSKPETAGEIYECAGPDILTLRELVQFAGRRGRVQRPIVALPLPVAKLEAWLMELMPGEPLMSRDNLLSMQTPNVATGEFKSLRHLGIEPRSIFTPTVQT